MTKDINMPTEIEPAPPELSPREESSLLFRLVTAPKYLGEAILKLIGYGDKADYIKMMVGYGIIIAIILILLSIIAPDTLKSLFDFLFLAQ